MDRRYSDMTLEELRIEIAQLTEKARRAEQMGMVNEYAVFERKIIMARAYMMNPAHYEKNDIYEINGDPGSYFKINYMNGVFAWGVRVNKEGEKISIDTKQEAMPISMLENFIEKAKS
jgi:hypothetical protein